MRVILQERLANLGNVGDTVTVKPGYGRNFLLPYGKAVLATPKNIEQFEKRRALLEKTAADALAAAEQRKEALLSVQVVLKAQASEEGKLYGSIGPRDIAKAVTAAGVDIAKSEVTMPEGPIRMLGEYDIRLLLHSEVETKVKVKIEAE